MREQPVEKTGGFPYVAMTHFKEEEEENCGQGVNSWEVGSGMEEENMAGVHGGSYLQFHAPSTSFPQS